MAESVLLFDENAYRNVICHGLILDDEGKKMSKSRAIADPWAIFATFGSDALRFYYLSAGDLGDEPPPVGGRARSRSSAGRSSRCGTSTGCTSCTRTSTASIRTTGSSIAPQFRPAIDRWILSELHQLDLRGGRVARELRRAAARAAASSSSSTTSRTGTSGARAVASGAQRDDDEAVSGQGGRVLDALDVPRRALEAARAVRAVPRPRSSTATSSSP